tara:strand:+ start:158 stop:742 length:585 start_codon:yes stop_codon:yes gene_type:complete
MKINLRDNLKLFSIAMIAIGTWLIKDKIQPKNPITTVMDRSAENRFYSKSTKIINTDGSGMHLFTLDADYVKQESSEVIKFYDVTISYSPQSKIRWILKSDSATKNRSDEYFILEGNVSASDVNEMLESSVIKTDQLQIDPRTHTVRTDRTVDITIDNNILSAKGMLAILNENKLELISEINGSFFKKNILSTK